MTFCRMAAPIVNDALRVGAQHLHSCVRATMARQWPLVGQRPNRGDRVREILQDDDHGCAEFVGFGEESGGVDPHLFEMIIQHTLAVLRPGQIS
jgi:hypothetical protein